MYVTLFICLMNDLIDYIFMFRYESIAFLLLYAGYIVVMVFNKRLDTFFSEMCSGYLLNYHTSYEETQKIMFAEISKRDNGGSKAAEAGITEENSDNQAHGEIYHNYVQEINAVIF